jgi:hypothetical protein
LVGIAGLGAYKQLHQIPGLGFVWKEATNALYGADCAVVVGFSMSDFDAMSQMRFADIARIRHDENRNLQVVVVDPGIDDNEYAKIRFRRVFREVEFAPKRHEEFEWDNY